MPSGAHVSEVFGLLRCQLLRQQLQHSPAHAAGVRVVPERPEALLPHR